MWLPKPNPVVYRGTATGLRISSVDGTAFIDNLDITSTAESGKVLHTGTVTQVNMRISAVDGAAFVDTSDATFAANLTAHIGKYLRIKDSSGNAITAWIKAQGSGETLNATGRITNTSFDANTNGWATYQSSLASIAGGYINNCLELTRVTGTTQAAYSSANAILTVGSLYKFSIWNKSGSSGNEACSIRMYDGPSGTYIGRTDSISTGSWVQMSIYGTILTAAAAQNQVYAHKDTSTVGTMLFDEASWKQVLTPSTSGVTLVSTKGGSTYNFEAKSGSFKYSDSSGYTYEIIDRDLSAFTDGTHSVEIYDSTGKFLRGVLKEMGTGETLDAEIATGTLTALKLYKITATEVNHFGTGLVVGSYFTSVGTETCDANNKVKQVLTPSTSGATIVSAKGGSTFNFAYKNASFTYNESSCKVVVKKIPGPYVVASGGISKDALLLDMTAGNAFAWFKGNENVNNGGFDGSTSGWTANLCSMSVVGDYLTVTQSSGTTGGVKQTTSTIVGASYTFSVSAKKGTSTAGLRIFVGSTNGGSEYYSSGDVTPSDWTTYTVTFTATGTSTYIYLQSRGSTGETSLFDTVSLVETVPDLSAYRDGNHMLEIYNSSGLAAIGYISADTPSESLDTALFSDSCASDQTSLWAFEAGGGGAFTFDTDHYNYTCTAGGGYYVRPVGTVTFGYGKVYKGSMDIKDGTGASKYIGLFRATWGIDHAFLTTAAFVTKESYLTVRASGAGAGRFNFAAYDALTGVNVQIKNFYVKRVLDPSATGGVRIVNGKGATTRNWLGLATTVYDSSTCFTYKIKSVTDDITGQLSMIEQENRLVLMDENNNPLIIE